MPSSRNATIALAALMLAVAAAAAPAKASVDSQFSAAVARILNGVHNDFIDGLSASEKRAFVSCAQKVMSGAPRPRKEYVLAASSTSQMRQRFDEVALDNRAELKQRITRECAQ